MQHLVLASSSPRRRELLSQINLQFEISVSHVDEVIDETLTPIEFVQSLALQKAQAVAKNYPDSYILGADTIVLFQNQILGKPKNENESIEVLSLLSGNTHEVITGVALIYQNTEVTFYEKTEVEFWELSKEDIIKYVATGEPKDKAGSYGIQELGSALVKRINGDYFSVVGLPVSRTIRELRKIGYII